MSKFTRFCAILLIIIFAIGIGFGTDWVWDTVDEKTHPQLYHESVTRYSVAYNVPEYVIFAVIKTESDFDPNAESSAKARGLMQMIESTFLELTGPEYLNENLTFDALYEPDVSIRYGTYYLKYLYDMFNYDWDTALAAYNGGLGNVRKWLKDPDCTDENGKLTYIPFSETRSYVSKVNRAMDMYQKLYYQPNEGVSA